MRLGGQEFKIKQVLQDVICKGQCATYIDVVGSVAPTWQSAFMPITDTGVPELENQLVYISDANVVEGSIHMRIALVEPIPLISMRGE